MPAGFGLPRTRCHHPFNSRGVLTWPTLVLVSLLAPARALPCLPTVICGSASPLLWGRAVPAPGGPWQRRQRAGEGAQFRTATAVSCTASTFNGRPPLPPLSVASSQEKKHRHIPTSGNTEATSVRCPPPAEGGAGAWTEASRPKCTALTVAFGCQRQQSRAPGDHDVSGVLALAGAPHTPLRLWCGPPEGQVTPATSWCAFGIHCAQAWFSQPLNPLQLLSFPARKRGRMVSVLELPCRLWAAEPGIG